MKTFRYKYHSQIESIKDGIPKYWLIKTYILFPNFFGGIEIYYQLIGEDGKDHIPFQTIENLENYIKFLNL